MTYIRFSENYKINKLIPITDSPHKHIKDKEKPYFISMMTYNQSQYEEYLKTKSLAGMDGSTTNRIWFDFDNEADLKQAAADCLDVVSLLIGEGIPEEAIRISFSGNKGFGIIVETTNQYTIEQVKSFCFGLAEDLPTFDDSMYDHQRIFRLDFTKNEKTGLYKIPLTLEELRAADIANIKETAKIDPTPEEIQDVNSYYQVTDFKIPEQYLNITKLPEKKLELIIDNKNIDWSAKPKFMSNCRWALQNGMFQPGFRSNPLLCLASTYKNLGYTQGITYRMLKGVAELESQRNNSERFDDKELYNNIVAQVYSERWKNGQFSCKEPGNFLYDYCQTLGEHSCKHDKTSTEAKVRTLVDLAPGFKEYVKNIDKNTIHTGIPSIDKNVFISTGANVGIIGAAGSGKTSLALDILNNTSKAGVKTVVASLDMHNNRMFEKVMYRITGLPRDELYKIYQNDQEGQFLDKLKAEFGNTYFFQKSMATVSDIREHIHDIQNQTGDKVKLVMIDYFERIMSDMSDDTAASKRISGELQDLVNDLDIALITLVQPNKFSIAGGPDKPILNYTAIKGSSHLYQSFRIIMSLWRPFYTPETPAYDHYMQMAVLKNDLGELNQFVFNWNGKKGSISEMEDFQKDEFFRLLKEKESQSDDDDGSWK